MAWCLRVGGQLMPGTLTFERSTAEKRAESWPGAYAGLAELVPLYLGEEPVRSERLPARWDR